MYTKNYYVYENIRDTNSVYWEGGPSYSTQYEDLGLIGNDGNALPVSFKTSDGDYYDDLMPNYRLNTGIKVTAGSVVEVDGTGKNAYNIVEYPDTAISNVSINFGIDSNENRKIIITGEFANNSSEVVELSVFGVWKETLALDNSSQWVHPTFLIAVGSPETSITVPAGTTYNFVIEILEG